MPRLYIAQPLAADSVIELTADAAAHARALRLRPGDTVTLFNGNGGEHASEVVAVERRRVTVHVGAHQPTERELPAPVQLLQAVGKGERMDTAVEKATELGASEIVPVMTERTVVRLNDPQRASKRRRHWEAVARAACEQCGRNTPPRVTEPVPLGRAWAQCDGYPLRLTLDPLAEPRLSELTGTAATSLLIGPEGGLSPAELQAAEAHGYRRGRAGPRVLRTETAAVVALAAVGLALGEL
ncbi:16S rRNA (uracil(1498)-N(3))-methyltransferase [Halorhodospira halophila]|uniref:16S rRNA (uracil(1498)-N(3))-methyltransferase n=1 Tax=Halorhodospira halophila TaxID=1053 RepID=UPI001914B0E9|nr:16S rRNA (uracil(1498)-N(3))-methyltransferase [Halorhodospira halophila]MBK5943254.1 16S rRNA (uracil(1498)-N(3))-methyltransferase [Halorhodospira halophila]